MPRKRMYRKKKNTFRRKFMRKNVRRQKKYLKISKLKLNYPTFLPDKLMMKMKYSDTFTFGSIGYNERLYNGNSIFDPDRTGVGHQPYGFDQISSLYGQYKVHGCKIKITAINNSSVVTADFSVTPVQGSVSILTSTQQSRELPYNKYRNIPVLGSNNKVIISMYMSSKVIFGNKIYDDDYSALITANPAIIWMYIISGEHMTGSLAVTIDCQIDLTYYVTWSDRRQLAQS